MDPLLKDLNEKKQSFRRTVVSLAAELRDVRARLASQEQSLAQESRTRQAIETKARSMEDQILQLRKGLEEKDGQLLQSTTTAQEQYLKELDDLRSQLSATKAIADANAALAQSAELQCMELLKELDDKNCSIKEHEDHIELLRVQIDFLHKDLRAREDSQNELTNEVYMIEQESTQAAANPKASKLFELGKFLEEVSPTKSLEKINKHLTAKDEEIGMLKEEIMHMSAHWIIQTKDLESQVEKHQMSEQELKKKISRLEFNLQEARSQLWKLQRMGERKDKALKELRKQLVTKAQGGFAGNDNSNFWESSGFKILISMSVLILVLFSKR